MPPPVVREVVSLWARNGSELALTESQHDLLWLPYAPAEAKKSYGQVYESLLDKFDLKAAGTPKMFLRRVRSGESWWQNVIFKIDVESRSSVPTWVKISELNTHTLQSDEIVSPSFLSSPLDEVALEETMCVHKDLRASLTQVFESAKFSKQKRNVLSAALLDLVWPCEKLHWRIFSDFIERTYNKSLQQISDVFRVCCPPSSTFARPFDVLCALACLDPLTAHGDASGEMRCRYIFRFYDRDEDGFLSKTEVAALVRDVEAFRNPNETSGVDRAVAEAHRTFGIRDTTKLSMNTFLAAVGKLLFRGTSTLFRAPCSILLETESREPKSASKRKRALDEEEGYSFALHTVRVRRSGTVSEVLTWWDAQSRDENQNSGAKYNDESRKEQRVGRSMSVNAFNEENLPNELLMALRYFEHSFPHKSCLKGAFSWGQINMSVLATSILKICESAYNALLKEDRLLRLRSPTYILGDIHGNFRDLLCFEKALWRTGPVVTPCTFLFLGDFVDRGPHSIEVIIHLFSNKLLAPEKFYLLRGNHEVRSLQRMFGFYSECCEKFGEELGQEIWEAVNQCFDAMPLAAVIDDKLFCVHGGIPPDWLLESNGRPIGIEAINSIPKPLPDPEEQSPLAWELMWSDPLPSAEQHDPGPSNDGDGKYSNDFRANRKRRTAHMFSSKALDNFLESNELSHVIRAHEVQQAGFQVQQNERLLTVFSSSHYCGGSNEAACVLADRHKLRMIRIDTS